MNRQEKLEAAKVFSEKLEKSKVAIFADYKGLTATQADELRKQLRAQNAEVQVLRNSVARLSVSQVKGGASGDKAKVIDGVVGPTLVAFAYSDPAAAAKVIHRFSLQNEALRIKESLLGDKLVLSKQVEELAELPGREVLLARLLGQMNAPVSNFVGVLAAVPRGLVTVLSAIQKKKES